MLDDGPLKTFLVLADEGKMTRAATLLHRTQPALSSQLARLEDEVGTRLFHRTPKGLVLTEAGRLFKGYVEDALMRLSDGMDAVRALAGLERGELTVGGGATATTYLLPPVLKRFHERFPAIRLRVRELGSAAVTEAVLAGDLDLGIVTRPTEIAQRIVSEPWVEDELLLIVPTGHRLAARKSFRWKDLAGQALVMFEPQSAVRLLIDDALARAGVAVEIVMEVRSIDAIQQMVAQGIGAGFVSRWALAEGRVGLRCADGALVRELAVVRRADRAPSAAANAFLADMREALRR